MVEPAQVPEAPELVLPPPAPHPAEAAAPAPNRVTGVPIQRQDPVDAAIARAANSTNAGAAITKAVYLEVGKYRYRCVPKPPGHATATISRLTGTVASASINRTPAQIKERATTDPEFLLTISTAPGELADVAMSLIVEEELEHFKDRWMGKRGVPPEEFITEPDLIPALMDMMSQYTKQTVPLASPSTDT